MTHLDLFAGIGGWALAAQWTWRDKHKLLAFVERDKYCQKILNKNFPGVPIIGEIAECDGTKFKSVGLITGSPPCQPFSFAGERQGKADDRHLWPEMFRILKEAKPRWVCVENVAGIAGMVLDEMLDDLESADFEAQTFLIPACGVGANHRRDRIWIVAHTIDSRRWELLQPKQIQWGKEAANTRSNGKIQSIPDTTGTIHGRHHSQKSERQIQQPRIGIVEENVSNGNSESGTESGRAWQWRTEPCDGAWWKTEPGVDRVVDGIPHRVDRLRGLGNAIVPQVATRLLEAIKQVECE